MAIDALTVGAIAFGGGGIVGGVITLLRFPSDKSKVVVETAQGAVVVQKGVIDSLTMEIARLNTEVNAALATPDVRDQFIAQGGEPSGGTPQELDALIKREIKEWTDIVRKAGIKSQ